MAITIDGDNGISGVNGSATTPALQGTDSNTGIVFGTDEVQIATGGSTRATVDSSGDLLLNGGSDVRIELGTNGTTATNDRNHLRGDGDNLKYNCCADGVHVFETNGTEAMRLDSSGRLLVGKTSHSGDALFVVESNHSSGGIIGEFDNNDSGNFGGMRILGGVTDRECRLQTLYGNSFFTLYTEGSGAAREVLRIDSDGFQASTSSSHGIEMGITAGSSSLNTIFRGRFGATAGSFATGTISFNVYANGDVNNTNNSYTAISDITLKENIVPASSQWDNIKDIEVVNYNFREETGYQTHKQLGVIAQQVEEVSPGLVKDGEEGLKTVNYSVLYMKAVKALQEAQTRIETLESQHADLLARVTALEVA